MLLAAAGCGDEEPEPAEEAAAGLAEVVAQRADVDPASVVATCPEELEVEVGTTFRCAVALGDADPVDIDLAVTADGAVELQRAVVPTAAAEEYLAGKLAGPAEGPVQVSCGDAPLLVADVGDQLRCQATRPDGTVHGVVVEVLSLDGTVRYQVEPAGSVADSAGG